MLRKLAAVFTGALLLLSSASCASEKPKYVFLFIGDGMGPNQRHTANLVSQETTGKPMVMESLPVRGQIHTRSADSDVTDSAASATALAAGVKTNNGVIGQLPDGTAVESISSTLSKDGYKVGVITSVGLNHATPGGFLAHADNRNQYNNIASDVPASGAHLVIGNGLLSENQKQDEAIASWTAAGTSTIRSLKDAPAADGQLVAILDYPGATTEKNLEGPGELANSVSFAIDRLNNKKGFFIMTEGGKVDSGGHSNRAVEAIDEAHALDRAVKVAYDFYRRNPDQTLIVITADHETGGMTFDPSRFNASGIMSLAGMDSKYSAALKGQSPLTAEAAEKAMDAVLGIGDLTGDEKDRLAKAVEEQAKKDSGQVTRAAMAIAQARAGITWTTGGHTGVDVPVTAVGVGSEEFVGTYDNTQIPKRILKVMGAKPAKR